MIIESLCTRGEGKREKNRLVVFMSEYKPYARAIFESIDESGSFGMHYLSVGIEAFVDCERMHLEFRKKRPYERGKKKRKKGKRDPIRLLWKSTDVKNCNSEHSPD